jgi:hypothetical protein
MENRLFNRIIQRFTVLYGQQKVTSVFGGKGDQQEATAQAWEYQLSNTDPGIIRKVLEHLANGSEWPPALAEWAQLCRDFRPPVSTAAPMLEYRQEPTEEGKQVISQTMAQLQPKADALRWARFPKSASAIVTLVKGAEEDQRLRSILMEHIADDGARCEPDAQKVLHAVAERMKAEHELR